MVAAQEKWPDIGQRISCVGPFVTVRRRGDGGGRMDGGAEGSGAGRCRGGGRGVMNSWPIPSRMPSNLCYKEGHPSSGQAAPLYTATRTRKTHGAHAGLTLTQKGRVITARGPCASPRKLYYTLQCGGMFSSTTFRCRKRCCS